MKKKLLALIIAVLLTIPCCITASAWVVPDDITLNEGYQSLVCDGVNYMRFDSSLTEWEEGRSIGTGLCDLDEVDHVNYDVSVTEAIITAEINLTDGSSIKASYISEKYAAEHTKLAQDTSEYTVCFYYLYDEYIKVSHDQLFDEKTTVWITPYAHYPSAEVNVYGSDDSFYIRKGLLYLIQDEYYYIDFRELGIKNPDTFFAGSPDGLPAYKITDPELLSQFDGKLSNHDYNEDYNWDYTEDDTEFIDIFDNDLTNGIAKVLLSIAFAVIPLAVFILFLILSIRAKAPAYKKLFRAICIIAAIVLVIFTVTVVLFALYI